MAQWNPLRVLPLTLAAAAAVLAPAAARADDFILGNWENNSTDGWIDWGTQSDITAPEYTFSSDTGVKIGQPIVAGATVTAKLLGMMKDDKVYVERHVRRKGFHRRVGHRQRYLAVQIETING